MSGELKLRAAMDRRARAFDLASLCRYTVMGNWHQKLFHILEKEGPANAVQVTLQQASLRPRREDCHGHRWNATYEKPF